MFDASHSLPIASLDAYLEQHIPGFRGLREALKYPGGQSNPTYRLEADSGRYVLRRKPPGVLLKSAHAVDREFRVISALRTTNVPVPQAFHLCEDDSVIGSMFYVMEYMDGRNLWEHTLPELDNTRRAAIYDEMNRVLSELHKVDVASVGLSDYGRPGNYYARQISRWTGQYRAAETQRVEAMEQLMAWLESNIPPDDGRVSLAHGDYRLDNLIFHPREDRIIAVLDWELSTLGHPFADIAYQCVQWRLPHDARFLRGLVGVDRLSLGIPTEEAYVVRYCERMGIGGIAHWNFYLAVSFFRLAAICQGVYKRSLDGNASSPDAAHYGDVAGSIARTACTLLDDASN